MGLTHHSGSGCPLKAPFSWTKTPPKHRPSTKGTRCVDRREQITVRVHKIPPACGQKPPSGTRRPQKAPSVWTGGRKSPSASTKYHPSVDKSSSVAPTVHKRHPLCGQAGANHRPRPQNTARLWTKAPPRHRMSTKGNLSVDKDTSEAPAVHRTHPLCGQAAAN